MNSMGVQATLAVLLLFIATVKAGKGGVTFSGEEFTMTCPESGAWFKKLRELNHNEYEYKLKYDGKSKGLYHCEYPIGEETKKQKYYFYVKGKVCVDCFELDPVIFGVVIAVDVLGTAFLMMIIYRCTKKKTSAGGTHTPKAPARSGGRAPPVPSPDYEPLSHHTRANDPYSVVNRTG